MPGRDHRDDPRQVQRRQAVQHVADQRPAGDAVHHLREAGFHARALAGGKDDGGSFGVWHDGLIGFLDSRADRPAAAAQDRLQVGCGKCHIPLRVPSHREFPKTQGNQYFENGKIMTRTPRRNTLVFDLDGTLVDSGLDIAAAVNALFAELGLPAVDWRPDPPHGRGRRAGPAGPRAAPCRVGPQGRRPDGAVQRPLRRERGQADGAVSGGDGDADGLARRRMPARRLHQQADRADAHGAGGVRAGRADRFGDRRRFPAPAQARSRSRCWRSSAPSAGRRRAQS